MNEVHLNVYFADDELNILENCDFVMKFHICASMSVPAIQWISMRFRYAQHRSTMAQYFYQTATKFAHFLLLSLSFHWPHRNFCILSHIIHVLKIYHVLIFMYFFVWFEMCSSIRPQNQFENIENRKKLSIVNRMMEN